MSRTHYKMSEGAFDHRRTLFDVVENRIANERYFRPDWSPKDKTTEQIAEELWPADLETRYSDVEVPAEHIYKTLDQVLHRDLAYHIQILAVVAQALPREKREQQNTLLSHARSILVVGSESAQENLRWRLNARWANLLEEHPEVHAKVWLAGVLDEEPHNDPPIEGLRELARETVLSRREALRLVNELAKHVED